MLHHKLKLDTNSYYVHSLLDSSIEIYDSSTNTTTSVLSLSGTLVKISQKKSEYSGTSRQKRDSWHVWY